MVVKKLKTFYVQWGLTGNEKLAIDKFRIQRGYTMIISRPSNILLLLLWACLSVTPSSAQQVESEKVIKIILKVETEDQGVRLPAEKLLTTAEISQLRRSIIKGLSSLPNVRIVTSDEKDDAIGILVVAEKLNAGREYIILSSVLTIAQASGPELFVSHNVFAQINLDMAAKAVVYQFVSAQLQVLINDIANRPGR